MKNEKENKIKKDDLNLMALEFMDLKFNKGGYDLVCDYLTDKMLEDGIKISFDEIEKTGEFNGVKINYATQNKREGIKEMTKEILKIGEDKNLTEYTPLGIWLNHAVETMALKIINNLTEDITKFVSNKQDSLWDIFTREEDQTLLEHNGINIYKVQELIYRIEKRIKHIKYEEFVGANLYVW